MLRKKLKTYFVGYVNGHYEEVDDQLVLPLMKPKLLRLFYKFLMMQNLSVTQNSDTINFHETCN